MMVFVSGVGCESFARALAAVLESTSRNRRRVVCIRPDARGVSAWAFCDRLSDSAKADAMLYLFADTVHAVGRSAFDCGIVTFERDALDGSGLFSSQALECASAAAASADVHIDCGDDGDACADLIVGAGDVRVAADYLADLFPQVTGRGEW